MKIVFEQFIGIQIPYYTFQVQTYRSTMAMEKQRLNLVSALSFLFYLSTCCGILPYSIRSFNKHKSFKLSVTGNVFSAAVAVFAVVQYHISSQAFSVSDKNETGTRFYSLKKSA